MKRIILCLMVALSTFSFQAKAQWVVTDPTNLIQNVISAVQGTTTATNMISNVQESIKIYKQGKEFYDALKSVNNLIKDARKVQKTIEMISEITDIYVSGFNKMVNDPNFTPEELAAISYSYSIILDEGGALVVELRDIVTGNNGLSLSDKERMEVIDQVYNKMLEYRNLTRYFTQKSISVSYLRAKVENDMERVLSLYGSPSERYW
jgi:Conjugal transfer/entry exclusion protein